MALRTLRRRLRESPLGTFLMVLGPGIIAASTGNDAGGITTYSQAGAQYGYNLLWVMLILTFSLAVAQEMSARMAAVTGKGLADLIREEFGVKVALLAMGALLVANIATTVANIAGVTAVVELVLPSSARYFVVPALAYGIWWMLTHGTYRRVERIFLAMCAIYLVYVASAFLAHPPWPTVLRQMVMPDLKSIQLDSHYVTLVIALVGTTIAPWMQFFVQSSVRDKGITAQQYGAERIDVLTGTTLSNTISFFIIVTCGATIYGTISVDESFTASVAARALVPVAGVGATALFAIGLFNAGMVGAIAVPLSTAYAITESLGWESGVGRRVREAPLFTGVFTGVIVVAAIIVMVPNAKLLDMIVRAQLINGILLPVVLVISLLLVNKRRLMGSYTNGRIYNVIAGATVISVALVSLLYLGLSLFG